MDLSAANLFAGMVVSTAGMGLFIYGKREDRHPSLLAGLVMMAVPFFIQGAFAVSAAGVATGVALWIATDRGL